MKTFLENPNYQCMLERHSNYLMREVMYAIQGETGFEEVDYYFEDECFSPLVLVELRCQPIDNELNILNTLDHLLGEDSQ